MDDAAIINLYWQRDESAIAATHLQYGGFCHRIAINILYSLEDAQECVNDAYHKAWNAMPPQRPGSLRAFLARIVRNLSLDRYRANRAKKRDAGITTMLSELDDCLPSLHSVEREIEAKQLSQLIDGWLHTLAQDDRVLFVRRYFYGDAVGALATQCGVTPNQMAQRMLRLRKSLKAALDKEGVAI